MHTTRKNSFSWRPLWLTHIDVEHSNDDCSKWLQGYVPERNGRSALCLYVYLYGTKAEPQKDFENIRIACLVVVFVFNI